MIKNKTFLDELEKKIDETREWSEEFGAIYEEFGANELEEFALWGYEQVEKYLMADAIETTIDGKKVKIIVIDE